MLKKPNSSLQKYQLKFERELTKNYLGIFSMSLRKSRSIKKARPTPLSNLSTSWPQDAGFLSQLERSGAYRWAPSCSFHSFFPPHLSLIKETAGCALPVAHACLLSGLQLFATLLCPWDSPDGNTGVGCHAPRQGIFPTQDSNLRLLRWQADSLPVWPLSRLRYG